MTTSISDAGMSFSNGSLVGFANTIPTTGSYTAGDIVLEKSSSVICPSGWKRITTGSGHVLGTDWVYFNGIQLGTSIATTSGTSIDFTGIPAGVKRVTVMLNGVSTNGTSVPLVQLGAGSILASGYSSFGEGYAGSSMTCFQYATGFGLTDAFATARSLYGQLVFTNMGSNIWTMQGANTQIGFANGGSNCGGGVTLSGTLDRLRLTTVNGTDAFDAGSVNISWEF